MGNPLPCFRQNDSTSCLELAAPAVWIFFILCLGSEAEENHIRQPRRPAPKWAAPIPDQPLPGIVDPAKVVRVALQDAASIAGLLITTEAMVAEAPKRDRRRWL